jgi:hypothetical protein
VLNPNPHFTLCHDGRERRCGERQRDLVQEGEVTGEQQSTYDMQIYDITSPLIGSGMWQKHVPVHRWDRWCYTNPLMKGRAW